MFLVTFSDVFFFSEQRIRKKKKKKKNDSNLPISPQPRTYQYQKLTEELIASATFATLLTVVTIFLLPCNKQIHINIIHSDP